METSLLSSPKEIAAHLGASLLCVSSRPIVRAVTDSRFVTQDSLFCAMEGAHTDGHRFLADAVTHGASALLCRTPPTPLPEDVSVFCVPDVKAALQRLAAAYLAEVNPTVVAVTGSTGKTTVKEWIAAACASRFRIHKTDGNQNNDIGFPLTVLSMPRDTTLLVAELGMNHAGELTVLSKLAHPHFAVITNIGSAHIGNFGSREGIALAKREILTGLREGGICLIPQDEPFLAGIPRARTVGVASESDYRICAVTSEAGGSAFSVITNENAAVQLKIGSVGPHFIYDAAVAFAVSDLLQVSPNAAASALSLASSPEGRGKEIIVGRGVFLRDESYNASPESMAASLSAWLYAAKARSSRTVAVLGEMLELGECAAAFHRSVGKIAAGADLLFAVGEHADALAEGAMEMGMQKEAIRIQKVCGSLSECEMQKLATAICATLSRGDSLFFKASHGMAFAGLIAGCKAILSDGKQN